MQKIYRKCPKCNIDIECKNEKAKNIAIKRNSTCRTCINKDRILTHEHKLNITNGMKNSDKVKANAEVQKITFKGEGNPMFGKTLSDASRKKLSDFAKTRTGINNPFFGKSHSINSRESMSSSRAEGISNGTIQVRYHNTGIHLSTKTNVEERYDSKLELFRMIQLDLDLSVISWTKIHNIKIAYNNKEIIRHYIPDFKITYADKIVIEEVKGWEEGEKTNLKQEALSNYCKENNFTYRWIFQDDIIFKEYKQWLKII